MTVVTIFVRIIFRKIQRGGEKMSVNEIAELLANIVIIIGTAIATTILLKDRQERKGREKEKPTSRKRRRRKPR